MARRTIAGSTNQLWAELTVRRNLQEKNDLNESHLTTCESMEQSKGDSRSIEPGLKHERSAGPIKLTGSQSRLFLAMSNFGSHTSFFAAYFTATFAGLFSSHSVEPHCLDGEYLLIIGTISYCQNSAITRLKLTPKFSQDPRKAGMLFPVGIILNFSILE